MHRNITIDEKAYNLLASLKTDPRDSFTKVILRHVRKPANTCGELLEVMKDYTPPPIDEAVIKKFIAGRGPPLQTPMIADTTFAWDYFNEQRRGIQGPATGLMRQHRVATIRLTIITAGEISVIFPGATAARAWLDGWQIYPLHMGIVDEAADVDRALIRRGRRLGENDNWIAGFARYYREPVISRDRAFDQVPGVRRVDY